MKAAIISVGDELITGQSIDTNSAYLAGELLNIGIEPISFQVVGDDVKNIESAIRDRLDSVELILMTGGLGPTEDDLTRYGISNLLQCDLKLSHDCLQKIADRFNQLDRPMSPSNKIQAMIPALAEPIDNNVGTAPGISAQIGKTKIYAFPGVPREMKKMFADFVYPQLPKNKIITKNIVHLFGTGESVFGEKISDLMNRDDITVGITVSNPAISVRILSEGETETKANEKAYEVISEIKKRLGDLVVGVGPENNMPMVVSEMLREKSATLSCAESCTGGLVSKMITDLPGSSSIFLGGIVSYSNNVKIQNLQVPLHLIQQFGAVSEQIASSMALQANKIFKTTYSIAITGVAGPAGGTDEKPVGLVYIAIAKGEKVEVYENKFTGPRNLIRNKAALTALNYLRLLLTKE